MPASTDTDVLCTRAGRGVCSGRSARFVQLPHPGGEHVVTGDTPVFAWSTGEHRRKFLSGWGRLVDGSSGRSRESEPLTYWGEWEAWSRPEAVAGPAAPGHPRWLHSPLWSPPPDLTGLQNTDPFVLGRQLVFSNCRQDAHPFLRALEPGTIVLFGSVLGAAFVLDTVLVVDRAQVFVPADRTTWHGLDEVFVATTAAPLAANPRTAHSRYTLYRGVRPTAVAPLVAPFSFVPALPGGDVPFARPTVEPTGPLAGLVTPLPAMAPGGAGAYLCGRHRHEAWRHVVGQVADAGVQLGVDLHLPPRADSIIDLRDETTSPQVGGLSRRARLR